MDKELKTLLIEIAKGVLRALDPPKPPCPLEELLREPQATYLGGNRVPAATAVAVSPADKPAPKPPAPAAKPVPPAVQPTPPQPAAWARGCNVRFWDGDKFVVGEIVNVCRKKVWQPQHYVVHHDRGEGRRGKSFKIDGSKLVGVSHV